MKIRNLRVNAFRGVRNVMELDFTNKFRSVAIFGENGTGKSTITDGIEWFVTNRVGHLWAEDCKDEAIRNIFADDGNCGVTIEFSDASAKSSKVMRADSKVVHSNKSKEFSDYLAQAAKERIFLRHADVAQFVTATKNQKRDEIEKIIGYEAIKKFRDVIRQTKNKLESASDYQTAKRLVDQSSSELVSLTQSTIAKEIQLFDFVNERLREYQITTTVNDFSGYDAALEELKARIGDPSRAERKIAVQSLRADAEKFRDIYAAFQIQQVRFGSSYLELLNDSQFRSEFAILDFLNKGLEVINKYWNGEGNCPFCLSASDLETLKDKVLERIAKISALNEKFNLVQSTRNELYAQIDDLYRLCLNMRLSNTQILDADTQELTSIVEGSLPDVLQQHRNAFGAFQNVNFDEPCFSALGKLSAAITNIIQSADVLIQQLTFSDAESKMIQTLQVLTDARRAFLYRQRYKKLINTYQNQIFTLGDVYDKFILAQNKALQDVLDAISKDVDNFFSMLHPSATIKGVQLKILGEQGIEFEYSFHGRTAYPPKKYLSESFLNSLGLSLFLASAKLFNERSRFLILDDIVTSFDQNLRRRLIRLLTAEFSDWQLILLTHEEFLYQLMRREFPSQSWSFFQVRFDSDNGSTIQDSGASQEEFIVQKRKKHDVSNDLRKYLEQSLKDICYNLEAKVPFLYNDRNELRMSDELLAALRRSVKEHKCTEVLEKDIFTKLDGSILITNRASHDSSNAINDGDIEVALGDIKNLRELFQCKDCQRFVNVENVMAGEKKISCKCGKKKLSWTD